MDNFLFNYTSVCPLEKYARINFGRFYMWWIGKKEEQRVDMMLNITQRR
jgi:hypothetical protein